ncbi:MAG: hypothetical protein HUJ68_12655, partial [Clostridia bacterium]|nr:hypothetical protein [Clostridia bacterium]
KLSNPSRTYKDIKQLTLTLMKAVGREKYLKSAMGLMQLWLGKTTSTIKREGIPNPEEIGKGLADAMKAISPKEIETIRVKGLRSVLKESHISKLINKMASHQEKKINKNINPNTVQKISDDIPLISNSKIAVFEEKNKLGQGFIAELIDGKIHKISETQPIPYIESIFKDLINNNVDSKECVNEFLVDKHALQRELLIDYNMKDMLQKLETTNKNSDANKLLKEINIEIDILEQQCKDADPLENYYSNKISYMKSVTDNLSERNPLLDKEINEICSDNLGVLPFEKILLYESINKSILEKNIPEKFDIKESFKEIDLQLDELKKNSFNIEMKNKIDDIINIQIKEPVNIQEINSIYNLHKGKRKKNKRIL